MQSAQNQTILLVEDTIPVAHIYEQCLRREGYQLHLAENGKQAFAFLDTTAPLALVLDLMLPDTNGLEILQYARKKYPELPVIVVTATNSVNVAVEAMRRGAFDFIIKPVSPTRLTTTVRNALERKALADEVAELRHVVGINQFHNIIGQSASMQAIYRIIDSVATSKAGVLISGEAGTGKAIVAHAIHKASPRREQPFITLDCSAIPPDKIESRLFGHCEETFVGLIEDQRGAIMAARDGTLLLNEICAMPIETQAKLLQFLQTGEVCSVGSIKTHRPDVRVIAATERNAFKQVHAGNLREDLYFRLNVVPVEMPALRVREDDVIMLAQHFLAKYNAEESKKFTSLHPDVMSFLRRYDWPGNVRQLEYIIRNIVVLNTGNVVTPGMLPTDLRRFAETTIWPANQNYEDLKLEDYSPEDTIKPLWLSEKQLIEKALDVTNQDINTAATLLQISPSALYRKIHSWKSATSVA